MRRFVKFLLIALVVVFALHLVAIAGVFAFARMKDREQASKPGSVAKPVAETAHKPLKQKGPKHD